MAESEERRTSSTSREKVIPSDIPLAVSLRARTKALRSQKRIPTDRQRTVIGTPFDGNFPYPAFPVQPSQRSNLGLNSVKSRMEASQKGFLTPLLSAHEPENEQEENNDVLALTQAAFCHAIVSEWGA